ncbi:hypothetical protein T484DRAFT_1609778, partial [Baffinella frigidus]
HSLTHSITPSPLPPSLSRSLNSLTHSRTHALTHSLTHSRTHSLTEPPPSQPLLHSIHRGNAPTWNVLGVLVQQVRGLVRRLEDFRVQACNEIYYTI